MPRRVLRTTTALALLLSLGLVSLPACKKKPKATDSDSPNTPAPPGPTGTPQPNPTAGGRDPSAPRSPLFGNGDARTATMRIAAEAHLRQILLALHNHHDTTGTFPGGFADKDGKPVLSWRVAILPYLDQDNLFKRFKLDEPWDSPTNKALIPLMPKQFNPPGQEASSGWTFYRGFTGAGTWLPLQQRLQPGPIHGARLTDFSDGTANTMIVADSFDPVPWTKPDEMPFAPNNVPRLGGVFASGFLAGMADGSVRFVRHGLPPTTIANLIGINEGNVVNLDN